MSTLTRFGTNFMSRVETAFQELRLGKPILLIDDENRENEGDMIIAAEKITPESMNFLIRNGSGIVCLCLTDERCQELQLPLMSTDNHNQFGTAFTVSIEARTGVTTGVSAADRVRTIAVAVDASSTAADLARPGHVFPLRAKSGGVLARPGHTEGSTDLTRLAGLKPAAAICELMNADGTMARLKEIIAFAELHSLHVLTIEDVISYRQEVQR